MDSVEYEGGKWCLIESDPGVFTELIQKFGATGVQVEELWSLEIEHLSAFAPVYGLILLHKFAEDIKPSSQGTVLKGDVSRNIFYAKQVIGDNCATLAILSILLNIKPDSDVKLGETLSSFKEFCESCDPIINGLLLSNSEKIRTVHNSFARQTIFEYDADSSKKSSEDVFHFVSYVPINGRVYELDGLEDGPIDHGPIPETSSNWLDTVLPVIKARIDRYQAGEIHFNLMAVVRDKLELLHKQLDVMMQNQSENGALLTADIDFQIQAEESRRKKWRMENIRRRHNYLPFIVELLKGLASTNTLLPLYDTARKEAIKKKERKGNHQKLPNTNI